MNEELKVKSTLGFMILEGAVPAMPIISNNSSSHSYTTCQGQPEPTALYFTPCEAGNTSIK